MRHILFVMIAATLGGCASMGGTQALATPWGAAGVHSFKPEKPAAPNEKKADAQIALLLDRQEASEDVMVATR
ncbi:MAG: hypothetical protein ABI885_26355 [Gammaproteobacteria bacterium]